MLTGFDLCRAALAVTDITAPEQSVLMVLAIMANDDGQCWPPINGPTGLTAKTKLSERSVQRSIQRLKELGHISRRQLRNGCLYTVHPRQVPVEQGATPATVAGDGETGDGLTPATQAARPATVAPKQPKTTIPKHRDAGAADATPEQLITGQRGRRIDVDWQPTKPLPERIAKVVAGWPPGRADDVLDEFRAYWLAEAGKIASKLDWDLTWQNRLRAVIGHDKRHAEREQRRHGNRPQYDRSSGWAARPGMEGAEPASLDDDEPRRASGR